MEIKTLEHYAVSRIMELENEVDKYETLLELRDFEIRDLSEKIEYIKNLLEIRKAHDYTPENPRMYVDIPAIWNVYNKNKFNEICSMFDLHLPSDNVEEEESEEEEE